MRACVVCRMLMYGILLLLSVIDGGNIASRVHIVLIGLTFPPRPLHDHNLPPDPETPGLTMAVIMSCNK